MSRIRRAAVAGRFYPTDPVELELAVRQYIGEAAAPVVRPKAIIVPHAGYPYSGPIAGSGYAQIVPLRGEIERVILLGPAHYVPVRGLAVSTADAFETPLGRIPLDQEAIETIASLPQVVFNDDAHAPEHSLEVHLPFLQVALGEFRLVPLLVGSVRPEAVAEVLERLWGGPETLIVVSSDLSHFHDHATATQLDQRTADCVRDFRIADLRGDRACGFLPIGGLLSVARRAGLRPAVLDVRNSGDTAGSKDRVVGYGAFAFSAAEPDNG
jgi:MEMO1 family protein